MPCPYRILRQPITIAHPWQNKQRNRLQQGTPEANTVYWQPGQELKTRPYKIEETIGQGGFGVTYKARHLGLNHQVVLKTPNAMLRNDPAYPRFEQRFIKEGQMLAQLSQKGHASIVRVSDLFTENDIPCLVMDLVPGDSLFNRVQQQGAIPETEAVGYIRQIAEALVLCHEMKIVHRDAHALNIMVANQTRAVLIDFGIAGDIAPIVSRTRLGFNPAFAPFEQIARGNGWFTVDVYSLGV
jgi:serine/threonine protein kinase